MPTFKADYAASVLIMALLNNDETACRHFGITDRTLRNYRRRLAEDAHFSAIFQTKKREFDAQWADSLAPALKEGIDTIKHIAAKVRQDDVAWRNPEMLKALAGAVLILGDVQMTEKLIAARITAENRPPDQIPGQVQTGDEGYIH